MIVVGLTGSIGMGKSTTAGMFADAGVPVWDADAVVHRLYGAGGMGANVIAAFAPDVVGPDGVDRTRLREAIMQRPELLKQVEAAIHPLVAQDRDLFLAEARGAEAALVLCDIPLLYETGADTWLDKVVVVTAPAAVQRARVLDRPGMTEAAFEAILAKQVPDAEKRRRADFLIDTGHGIEAARVRVAELIATLTESADA